ncbi:LPS-assembly protein LptD [Lysobacter solisilvae (ex Woo and Kim 2020)]|uniref:LPS-assembly protein LptD n=1 Tax=Agrilutibacter terrestris TaxID=2865112 RepID=A0A7H0FYX2_9GAMM|nr:LPS-assembly protein LptD [Lysobacter terrestris]QNP41238.1 LPS-assembly protein LptD [Lysobacter terrestris]
MRQSLRLLPLSLCIALALPAHAKDDDDVNWGLCPVVDALPGFDQPAPPEGGSPETRTQQPTDIEGDELQDLENSNTLIQGNVSLSRGDQALHTDKLTFNRDTGDYVAEGSVRYQDAGMRVLAERATGNQDKDRHRIEDLQYQLTSRRGNGGAEAIEMHGAEGSLIGSTYSTCDPAQRVWELRARRIDINTEEGMGVARNATLRIGKVPVLHVPWLMFPIDERRRTGLLYPSISMSGRNGFDWRQPIYLNLAPNYDATLNPRYMSKRGFALGGEFRWLYPEGSGIVSGNYMPHDNLPGDEPTRYGANPPEDNRGIFQLNAIHRLGGSWFARANLGWVSDTHYFEDFSNSLYGLSASRITSSAGVYGRGRHWEAGLMADHHQLADYTLNERSLPFDRLPRAYLSWEQPLGWLEAGLDTELVRFEHADIEQTGPDLDVPGGSRFDFKPYISLPLEGSSWFLRPKLAWRYTGYQLDGSPEDRAGEFASRYGVALTPDLIEQFRDDRPTRSVPISSLDAGLFFDREATIRGDRYLHTLEPRIYYLHVPYEDQSGLPIFDTSPLTFSWGQLFRDNRYGGADRQSDANQLTTAITTRLIGEDDGRERLSVSLGQIKYYDTSRVVMPGEPPVQQGKSAWVAEATIAPSDRWSISTAYQWDPKFHGTNLASLRARYLIGDEGIVNIGYRYRRNPITRDDLFKQADFSFLYPVNPNWSVVGRYYYSLQDHKPLEQLAGVQWESCCLAVRVMGRRYLRNRTGELNNSLQVEFELKGLGSAGQDTRRILRRAILGYDRDDLYLVPPSSVNRTDRDLVPDPTP